ncbi:MAG TPA: hypothetical protein VM266_10795 [Solirubrobacteraceae bacterium]|nr:hypothetical protein [Solirubrobacteraceae bacterium]
MPQPRHIYASSLSRRERRRRRRHLPWLPAAAVTAALMLAAELLRGAG